jgi:hypothetical protein
MTASDTELLLKSVADALRLAEDLLIPTCSAQL